jgi:hypothetical protein
MNGEYQPLNPVAIERKVRQIANEMTHAQSKLAALRDEEVAAKHTYERTQRRALLSSECPKVTRGGWTTAERDAWVDEQCAPVRELYEVAEVHRKAAEDHLRTLFQQGTLAAVLAKSVHQAYQLSGVDR